MFENKSFKNPDDDRINDAMQMEPWTFCSKYQGDLGETENFWFVQIGKENYVWRKDTSQFQGYQEDGNFSPDFLERIEKERKRIEVGLRTGELVPNLKEINNKTAEEFAIERESNVKTDPNGSKIVVVDEIAYIWSKENKFEGVQLIFEIFDKLHDEEENDEDMSYEFSSKKKEREQSIIRDEKNTDNSESPNEKTIEYIREAMNKISSINLTREEAISIYKFIRKNKGDFYSSLPPVF